MKKIFFILLTLAACTSNPYQNATPDEVAGYKEAALPFTSGTKFYVSNSPYHLKNRHYSWEFDVPFGTSVHAIDAGKVISVWEPEGGGGCDQKLYLNKGHTVRVIHSDGSVAQYLHITAKVKKGEMVTKGQMLAVTANNGVVCRPNLHIMVYADEKDAGFSGKTIPLRFNGIPGGIALQGLSGVVP